MRRSGIDFNAERLRIHGVEHIDLASPTHHALADIRIIGNFDVLRRAFSISLSFACFMQAKLTYQELFADILIPERIVIPDEILHQLIALLALGDLDVDAARSQVVLRPLKSPVLADHDPGNLV